MESDNMKIAKVNIAEKLGLFAGHWSPRIVGQVNDMHVKLVKLQGEFVWHSHETEDEMFHVVSGELVMRFRDREERLTAGEFIIVPHGVEHQPFCPVETCVMLFEPATTVNTGDAGGERTKAAEWL